MRTTIRRTLAIAAAVAVAVVAPVAVTNAQVTSAGATTTEGEAGAVVANGRLLFGRGGDLYSILPTGAGLKRLTRSGKVGNAQWSPDGTKIAFSDSRSGNKDVYTMRADGTGVTRVTTAASDEWDPSWSKDGKLLSFTSNRNEQWEVYRLNATRPFGAAKRMTWGHFDHDDYHVLAYYNPRWSPVDNSILVTEISDYGDGYPTWRARLIDGKTGAFRPWSAYVEVMSYDWNPGGTQFAVSVDLSGGPQSDYNCIMRMTVPQSTIRPVTECDLPIDSTWSPVWSPDGNLIAYAVNGADNTEFPGDIHVIRPDGTGNRLFLRKAFPLDWAKS